MRRMSGRLAAVVAAAVGLGMVPGVAPAAPAPPSQDSFYTPSGSLAQVRPGTVLRTRTVSVGENGGATPITATQILYRTTGQLGQPTATVATIIRPAVTVGAPKIVSYQTAYDALGSQCDPSYTLQGGNSSYSTAQAEEQIILGYVQAGYTVVVPDYEGEQLDWAAGQESGENALDGIRAAENALSLPAKTTPVGMVGYSGGSIATDFAGELAPGYAPELDIVGQAEGGVPVDFFHNLAYINGDTDWAGVIPAVLVSLSRAFGVSFRQYLSPYGLQVTHQVQDQCINSFAGSYPGLTIQRLLKAQYANYLGLHDLVAIGDHLIMSDTGTPKGPVYIGVGDSDGTGDGIMVTADDEALAHTYCTRGVSVQFSVYNGANHTQAAVPFEGAALAFLTARLNGLPVTNGCASIGTGNSITPLSIPPAVKMAAARGEHTRGATLRVTGTRGARGCLRALTVRLASNTGTLTGVVLTLRRGRHVIARRRLARLTTSYRTVTLRQHGGLPRPGRDTLIVTRGATTLLTRTVDIRRGAACTARRTAVAPGFTG